MMTQICQTNYNCEPIWYTSDNDGITADEVVAFAKGPHAVDINITCVCNTGTIQFQVKDNNGDWFTPQESSYTVVDSNLVRLPRANMPDTRIIATGDATFSITGSLS